MTKLGKDLKRQTYTPYEAAKILGIGHNRVRELVRAGAIRALPGCHIKIPEAAVQEFLKNISRVT